ncbi:MAG: hypothetical protein KDN22_01170 [Verrucomicrobiae bacterium]|nr:hypothetical protein [Verrucomicrobiae bacterium]
MKRPPFIPFYATLAALISAHCQAQVYTFDEGNDAGWERLDPLAEAGVPAGTFTFPDGGYRLVHAASPSPEELGNARIGSFRPDVIQTGDFYISVDVTDWDDAHDQNIGILAMISAPGLGTTNGYALTLDLSEQSLYLSNVDFEMASVVANTPLEESVDTDTGFRLVFKRIEGEITGEIFALSALESPLATVEGFDNFIEEGSPGLFASADPASDAVDATFDNFRLAPEGDEPTPQPKIFSSVLSGKTMQVNFAPAVEGLEYILESSEDLQDWAEASDSFEPGNEAGSGSFEVDLQPTQRLGFYRIVAPD